MALEEVSSVKMYDGFQKVFSHESQETKTKMNFGIYLPKQIEEGIWRQVQLLEKSSFVSKWRYKKRQSRLVSFYTAWYITNKEMPRLNLAWEKWFSSATRPTPISRVRDLQIDLEWLRMT